MIELSTSQISAMIGAAAPQASAVITGPVVTNSRDVEPGSLFVALRGQTTDGHRFITDAVERGAVAVLSEEPVDSVPAIVVPDTTAALGDLARAYLAELRERTGLRVAAVTGSAGKTTTKDLLLQVLRSYGPTVAPVASFNNEVGLPLTVLRADETTRYLVLEMGANHLGELTYLTSIAPPDIAIVLLVGLAHVGEFGGIEAVAQAKTELVQGLLPDGVAILNADDLRVAAMAEHAPGPVVTFGNVTGTRLQAKQVQVRRDGGIDFTVVDNDTGRGYPVSLGLIGAHNVTNALATATAALVLGLPLQEVTEHLGNATTLSPHRMHVTDRPDGVTIIDDAYNANPDSMRAALRTLAVIANRKRRTIAVLGEMLEMGEDSRARHDEIGRLAVRLNISLVIAVGSGASGIFDGATQEGSWGDEAIFVETLDEAREHLISILRSDDVVLLKSSHGAGLWKLADELATGGMNE